MSWRGEHKKAVDHFLIALDLANQAGNRTEAAQLDYNLGDELAKMEAELPGAQLRRIDHRQALGRFDADTATAGPGDSEPRSLAIYCSRCAIGTVQSRRMQKPSRCRRTSLRSRRSATRHRQIRRASLFSRSAFCLLRLGRVGSAVEHPNKARHASQHAAARAAAWDTHVTSLRAHRPAALLYNRRHRSRCSRDRHSKKGSSQPSASNIAWLDSDACLGPFRPRIWPGGLAQQLLPPGAQRRHRPALGPGHRSHRRRPMAPVCGADHRAAESARRPAGCPGRRSSPGQPLSPARGVRVAPGVDGQRRYAIEDFAFSQAPSLGLLAEPVSVRAILRAKACELLAVDDPLGDLGELQTSVGP
ncbi:MAG: hypothetical protein MZW92_31565 [Comamonadaceae bacterium]|nr:hypothetical protein [Comamonadaceae bacterium]